MAKRIDPRIHNNFVDANFWDSSDNPSEYSAMLEILHLAERGVVKLILPFSVKAEIDHPNTPSEIKGQASGMAYTCRTQLTTSELAIRAKLLALIQGNAKPGKHDRDVFHLFEADKYGGGYFITKDVRLLKKGREVESLLTSLRVVCPSEFVRYVRSSGMHSVSRGRRPTLRNHARLANGDKQMREVSYKDYVIRPAPLQLADGRWNHELYVVLDRGYELVQRKFFSAASFATRDEAIAHCIAFGKQVIDGEAPNCSLDDL